jgi:hypothetical protein
MLIRVIPVLSMAAQQGVTALFSLSSASWPKSQMPP